MTSCETNETVDSVTRDFVLTNEQLEKVKCLLLQEFQNGLGRDTNAKADIKMFPTYVRDVPDGTEHGRFLALDLGGTNFRVLIIELKPPDDFNMKNRVFPIPQEKMVGSGDELFDHIAACMVEFIDEFGLKQEKLPLGFTFSFPCRQEGLTKAKLVAWTKGFHCTNSVGYDVVEMLSDALARRGDVDIDVMAVLNDTTGTLMSCAYQNRECRVGVIVGTGTNACYVEKIKRVELWDGDNRYPHQVIINCEWGAFGNNGVLDFIRNAHDREIDAHSLNKGQQIFEKMISGMYMGEIVRLVLVECTKKRLIFNGNLNDKLTTRNIIDTSFVSTVETDSNGTTTSTRKVLKQLGIEDATDDDCNSVKLICSRVSTRAAYLVSAAISTILEKMRRKHTTVGVDGSVFRYHPHFEKLMNAKITELTCPEFKFDLMLSQDGSGVGAALVAAVAVRTEKFKRQDSIASNASIDSIIR